MHYCLELADPRPNGGGERMMTMRKADVAIFDEYIEKLKRHEGFPFEVQYQNSTVVFTVVPT